MDRSRAVLAVLLACLLLSVQALNAADVEQGPILVHLKAGLDVDNEGRVSNVTFVDDERVPDAVRRDAERIARAWRFQPPSKAGKPVGGRTYAGIQACMVSSRDGIDYTFAFVGNGPAGTYRPPRKGHSPVMPIAKLMGEGVDRLGGKVVYVVAPDGTATVEEAVLDDPKLQARYGHLWLRDQRDYFKGFRYRPELIDGVATSTRIETVSEQFGSRRPGATTSTCTSAPKTSAPMHAASCVEQRTARSPATAYSSVWRADLVPARIHMASAPHCESVPA